MATQKARTRRKKTTSRPQGRWWLILLALASLASLGYFLFRHAPLFPSAPEQPSPGAVAVAEAPQPPAEEPLATPPSVELPPKPLPPAATATAEPVSKTPIPPPTAAPLPAPAPESLIAPETAPKPPAKKTAAEAPVAKPTPTPSATPTKAPRTKPMVAIVIDDMGYQPTADQKMLNLPLNLSFAFLPFGPHTKELAAAAQRKKRDILLHLPMEATNHQINPGPGTLTVAMDEQELQKKFTEELAAVPMAIGVNNHMGSLFTEQRPTMTALLQEVKQRGLFFLDSRTSTRSIACAVAKELDVPCLSRQVFLDNDQNQAAVGKQLDILLALAKKKGWAIGIGHPHPATLAALKARQQILTKQVELVGIGALTRAHAR